MKRYIKADTVDLFNEDFDVRMDVAKDPNTRPEVLVRLVTRGENNWLSAVALQNPNMPVDFLKKYAIHSNSSFRKAVAQNPSTPGYVLGLMRDDASESVLYCVADNVNTPPRVLSDLSTHTNYSIRDAVARNPSTPISTLEYLAKDCRNKVKFGLLNNPNLPDYLHKTIEVDGTVVFLIDYAEIDPVDERAFSDFARNTLKSAGCEYLGSGFDDMDPDYYDDVENIPGTIRQFFVTSSFIYDKSVAEAILEQLKSYVANAGYDIIGGSYNYRIIENFGWG